MPLTQTSVTWWPSEPRHFTDHVSGASHGIEFRPTHAHAKAGPRPGRNRLKGWRTAGLGAPPPPTDPSRKLSRRHATDVTLDPSHPGLAPDLSHLAPPHSPPCPPASRGRREWSQRKRAFSSPCPGPDAPPSPARPQRRLKQPRDKKAVAEASRAKSRRLQTAPDGSRSTQPPPEAS
jgi:hypothetical protein